jgi:hypothetical protein
MSITSPILAGAARAAELPGDSMASLLRTFGPEPDCSAAMPPGTFALTARAGALLYP